MNLKETVFFLESHLLEVVDCTRSTAAVKESKCLVFIAAWECVDITCVSQRLELVGFENKFLHLFNSLPTKPKKTSSKQ